MEERDLKGHLERLSTRGTPRGAGNVLEAAQTPAAVRALFPWRASGTTPTIRRYVPMIAIAASVALIGGVAAAVGLSRGGSTPQFATKPVTAGPGSTTTEAPV